MQTEFVIQTRGPGLTEFTNEVARFVKKAGVDTGLLTLFVRHTSCSILIQENADPDVQRDLTEFFSRLIPPSNAPSMNWVIHTAEGPDDMPAHIKAAMTPVSISIPITGGRMTLGTWQGIYLFEHRNAPHKRSVAAHISA